MQRKLINAGDPLSEDFSTGPDVGQRVPDFTLPDQTGNPVNFAEARGAKRALILFYRSASW
jgi:peroxiredoxin